MPLFDPLIFDTGAPSGTPGEWSLSDIMDALAAATPVGLTTKVYPWPVETFTVPALIVGYPTEIAYDQTFGRACDKLTIPIWAVFGNVSSLAARDELSGAISGEDEIKAAMEADPTLGGTCQVVRIGRCVPEIITAAGASYLAGRFEAEVWT